jgi:ATP-dependent RNA helicase RhlE
MSFDSLGLMPELLRAITERGYTVPTPVQAQAIPGVLAGRDMLAGAQTGTGKTAGFMLPILQLLSSRPPAKARPAYRGPRALVLVPTRELAAQVAESVKTYGRYLRLQSTVVYGGVSINPQFAALRRGTDILVATPGRLLDHAQQRTVDLSGVEILVLDEADRMLDMGFIRPIRQIIKLLPAQRQNLMFSATYSDEIRDLTSGVLRQPINIEVARRNAAVESVEQHIHEVRKEDKRRLASHLIRNSNWGQVLVFTKTKHGANRLARQLMDDGIEADAIHGNKSQAARTKALASFKGGRIVALVATEVAARGLDISQLPAVLNYELPQVAEDYVHRIGRTGRAGATGVAVSLVSPDERGQLRDIERVLRRSITRLPAPAISEPSLPPNRHGQAAVERRDDDAGRSHGSHHAHGAPSRDGQRNDHHRRGDNRRPGGNSRPARPGNGQSAEQGQPQRTARPPHGARPHGRRNARRRGGAGLTRPA